MSDSNYGMSADYSCKPNSKRVLRDIRSSQAEHKTLHLNNPVSKSHKPLGYNYPGGGGHGRGWSKKPYYDESGRIWATFTVEQEVDKLMYFFGDYVIVKSCMRMRFRNYRVILEAVGNPRDYITVEEALKRLFK